MISVPFLGYSQTPIRGNVLYQRDAKPAAAVNIQLLHHIRKATMTNAAGYFSLPVADDEENDTLEISSVGYQSIRLPLYIARNRKEFRLSESVKNLDNVTVFNKSLVLGATTEKVGYFRSWSYEHTGGEIGRVIETPFNVFKVDKVRFKAANFCDTCLIRLHIREFEDGRPGEELLTDSISLYVNQLTLDGKTPEFDLTPYDLTFTKQRLFVSLEVLHCGLAVKKSSCSFSFAGSEKGRYQYKSKAADGWATTDDYTIFLKLFLRY